MKKTILFLLMGVFCVSFLSSCNGNNKNSLTNSPILISEYIESSSSSRAIELYNKSETQISLNDYSLAIYFKGELVPKFELNLIGVIDPKSTFVVSYTDSVDEIKRISNMQSDLLMYNGTQQVVLKKKNKIIDVLGTIGTTYAYGQDITLVRKNFCMYSKNIFDEYDWIRYNVDNFKYLGNIDNSVTETELNLGPLIDEKYYKQFFIDPLVPNKTGGGVIEVTLYSGVDGDTAKFYYPDGVGIKDGTKVRFENINTPESYAANVQPWGIPAKIWTTERLKEAKRIELQTLENGELYDTFDRILAWVWTDGRLLNYDIVKNGFSEIAFSSVDNMFYKDISLTNWLYDAQLKAKKEKKGIWGEKDPYWDYENNTLKSEYSHLPNANP